MKIGLSTYSLRKNFSKGKIEFPGISAIKELFPEIEGVEILESQLEEFMDDTEPSDLRDLRSELAKNGLTWYSLTTGSQEFGEAGVPLYHPDNEYFEGLNRINGFRREAVLDWIETAGEVGIKMMRIDGSRLIVNHKLPIHDAIEYIVNKNIEDYTLFCKKAAEYGISIAVENHGGFWSDLKVLEKIFSAVPELKLCYDVGNVTDKNRLRMIDLFGDRILFVHAKTNVFDSEGYEKYYDYPTVIAKLKDCGFDGWLSIEFEGPGDEIEGVKKSISLLKKLI